MRNQAPVGESFLEFFQSYDFGVRMLRWIVPPDPLHQDLCFALVKILDTRQADGVRGAPWKEDYEDSTGNNGDQALDLARLALFFPIH